MIMNKMRFLTIGLLATIFSVVYSQQDGRDMRIVASYVKDLSGIWEMKDTLVTDSGTWTLSCDFRLYKDSTCYYSSGYSFFTKDKSKYSGYANAGLWGTKWDVGNWSYPHSYNILYLFCDGGEIESWRIIELKKDTLITRPTGQFVLDMLNWPFGQRKEIKWIRKK